MRKTYSTYEAKARFSEILRQVRAGETVYISYRGAEVAEIRPIERDESVEEALQRLRREGLLGPAAVRQGGLGVVRRSPGALGRFLASREREGRD